MAEAEREAEATAEVARAALGARGEEAEEADKAGEAGGANSADELDEFLSQEAAVPEVMVGAATVGKRRLSQRSW